MKFKLTKNQVEEVMECLYIQWDLTREDLEESRANKLAKIRDKLVNQYNIQLGNES